MANTNRICSVEACDKPVHCRALCGMHYRRLLAHGDVSVTLIRPPGTLLSWCKEHAAYHGEGCLIWPFARDADGYGLITVRGKTYKASRYICILAKGDPPSPQMDAAHQCGKGHLGCVNPCHLYWASKKQNSLDRIRHGTNGTKLEPEGVNEIRNRLDRSEKPTDIATDYGVSSSLIYKIASRKVWRSV